MNTSDEARGGTNRRALATLAVSAFVYVTAETLPVGLLPQISRGLSVSEAQVGLLLTTYAAVAAISTIPLTALAMRVPRRPLMTALVAIFALSQVAAAWAPTFEVLTISRLFCALAHGVFWSTIAPVAARLAPRGQAGRATSLVFLGNSIALVAGVPLGTALGQWAGWRMAFLALAVCGVVSTVALARVLPDLPAAAPAGRSSSLRNQIATALAVMRSRPITVISAITTVLVVGQFAAYTYIAPLARDSGGMQGFALSALLLGYGAAGVVGNVVVGRVVDRRPGPTLAACVAVIALALSALAVGHGVALTVVAVLAWGAAFTAVPVSLQSAILRVAPAAQDSASAIYVVAFQIGIGGGAFLGERMVEAGELHHLPGVGAALAAVAVIITLSARRVFPHRSPISPPTIAGAASTASPTTGESAFQCHRPDPAAARADDQWCR